MATSADRDERDEKNKAADDEAPADDKVEKAAKADEPKADAKAVKADEPKADAKDDEADEPKASAKAAKAAKDDEDDEEDDEDEDDDEDDDEDEDEEKPAPKAASKPASKSAAKAAPKAAAKPAKDDEDEEEEKAAKAKPAPKQPKSRRAGSGRGPGAGRVKSAPVQPQGGGSLGKSVLLFFVIVIGLGVGFMVLGREQSQEAAARPKWNVGQTVDVEITLVRNDRQDLACAAANEVAGKHCAFEAQNKPWAKGEPNDDKKLLRPYTTTEHVQFTAAGLWSEPALAFDKLPATRFSVKCKYKVEGNIKNMAVRWEQTGQWYPNNEWYAGTVSDCHLSG